MHFISFKIWQSYPKLQPFKKFKMCIPLIVIVKLQLLLLQSQFYCEIKDKRDTAWVVILHTLLEWVQCMSERGTDQHHRTHCSRSPPVPGRRLTREGQLWECECEGVNSVRSVWKEKIVRKQHLQDYIPTYD